MSNPSPQHQDAPRPSVSRPRTDPTGGHANRFYDLDAQAYAARTLPSPAPPLLADFSSKLPVAARVLDLGCGAGRELRALNAGGFDVVGVDLSPALAAFARQASGAHVIEGDMRTIEFAVGSFDGVLAVASLLHLTSDELPAQLSRIHRWLRPGGLFLASMKIGLGPEVMPDGRLFTYVAPEGWVATLRTAGFRDVRIAVSNASRRHSSSDHNWLSSLAVRR